MPLPTKDEAQLPLQQNVQHDYPRHPALMVATAMEGGDCRISRLGDEGLGVPLDHAGTNLIRCFAPLDQWP